MLPSCLLCQKTKSPDSIQPSSQSSPFNDSLDVSVDQGMGSAIGLLAAGSDLIVVLLVLQKPNGPLGLTMSFSRLLSITFLNNRQ